MENSQLNSLASALLMHNMPSLTSHQESLQELNQLQLFQRLQLQQQQFYLQQQQKQQQQKQAAQNSSLATQIAALLSSGSPSLPVSLANSPLGSPLLSPHAPHYHLHNDADSATASSRQGLAQMQQLLADLQAIQSGNLGGGHDSSPASKLAQLVQLQPQVESQDKMGVLDALIKNSLSAQARSRSALQSPYISPPESPMEPNLVELLSHKQVLASLDGSSFGRRPERSNSFSDSATVELTADSNRSSIGGSTSGRQSLYKQQQQQQKLQQNNTAQNQESSSPHGLINSSIYPLSAALLEQMKGSTDLQSLQGFLGKAQGGGDQSSSEHLKQEEEAATWGNVLARTQESFGSIDLGEAFAQAGCSGNDHHAHNDDHLRGGDAVIPLDSMPEDTFDVADLPRFDSFPFSQLPPLDTLLQQQRSSLASGDKEMHLKVDNLDLDIELDTRAPEFDHSSLGQSMHTGIQSPKPMPPPTTKAQVVQGTPQYDELAGSGNNSNGSDQGYSQQQRQRDRHRSESWGDVPSHWHEGLELLPLDAPIADMPEGHIYTDARKKTRSAGGIGMPHHIRTQSVPNFDSIPSSPGTIPTSSPGSSYSHGTSPTISPRAPLAGDFSVEKVLTPVGNRSPIRGRSPGPGHRRSLSQSPRYVGGESPLRGGESPNRKRAWGSEGQQIMYESDPLGDLRGDLSGGEMQGQSTREASGGSHGSLGAASGDGTSGDDTPPVKRDSSRGQLANQELPRKQRQKRGTATDPHAVAARMRRDKISQRMRTLYEMVPNANRGDTATMLEEAINYVRKLQEQVQSLSKEPAGRVSSQARTSPSTESPESAVKSLDEGHESPTNSQGINCVELSALGIGENSY